jgi:hypothetical protein
MSNFSNEEINIIVSALGDNQNALNIFLNNINIKCDHTIIDILNPNTNFIIEIDLTYLLETQTHKTLDFFYARDFPSLKKLILPKNFTEQSLQHLILHLFSEDRIDEFPSLDEIVFHSNCYTENYLHIIYNHFSLYTQFLRNIPTYSDFYKSNVVFIFIKNTGIPHFTNTNWLRGQLSIKNDYSIKYKNNKMENKPFIINVSR